MLMTFTRRKSRRKKIARWLVFVAFVVVCSFAAPPAYKNGKVAYKDWKCERALKQARQFFAAKEYPKANTALQVALRTDPKNIEVWKTIADMTEAVGRREAIQQRQQVVLLMPGNIEAQIALAMTALRFGDLFTARDSLKAVPDNFRDTTSYRRAVALYALLEGNGSTAEQVIASLMKTDSSDNLRLSYLTVRLGHPDPVIASSARQELAGMVEIPAIASVALRELMSDAILRKDFKAARGWSDRLVKMPDPLFNDFLAQATLFMLVDKKPLAEILPGLVEKASKDTLKMADLVRWLLAQRETDKAAELLEGLSAEARDSFAIKPLRVELAINRKDWPAAGELIRQGALGPIPPEAVRLMMEARSVGELQGEAARFAHWGKALDMTRTNIFGLRIMYQLGVEWKWGKEVEATLQTIAQNFPGQTWAHEALVRVYATEKNGPALQQIFALWSRQSVGVNRIRHDSTLMNLLVFGAKTSAADKAAAEELYQNEPSNPNFATTCALAYTFDGRSKEALAILARLKPAERAEPSRAAYLAFIYAKGRNAEQTREQLALVRTGALLNEEAALVAQARTILAQLDQETQEINQLIGVKPAAGAKQ